MIWRDFLFLRPECLNIHGKLMVMSSDELRLSASTRTLVHAILSGVGRRDVVAKLAMPKGRGRSDFSSRFKASLVGSRLIDMVSLPVLWSGKRVLVCDWARDLGSPKPPGWLAWSGPEVPTASAAEATRANSMRRRDGARRTGSASREPENPLAASRNRSLFVQAQLIRALLGTNPMSRLVLGGPVDRVLFGDLVFRHRCVTVLGPNWPEAKRVWQADAAALRDTSEWLESLFYSLRHARDEDPVGLSPRAGTAVASQEVRCLVDSKIVLCWAAAQQRELIRFYGRNRRNTPVIDGVDGSIATDFGKRKSIILTSVSRILS